MKPLSARDRMAVHLMIRLTILGYLTGVWWPNTRIEGLGIIVLLGYLIHDLLAPNRERDREKTSP